MQPQPILLYRRRWTLLFQVPFTLLMLLCLAYSLYWAYVSSERLYTALFLLAAFVTFCLAWTLGSAALKAYFERNPAVVIDASGITDLRHEAPNTVPWEAMERVHLDNHENVILIRLHPGRKDTALRVVIAALQRWQRRGDVAFPLGGLAYDTPKIRKALKAFHASVVPTIPSRR